MKISVIIPSYKPGDYLLECLKSIFDQTFTFNEYEVILILNGPSTPYSEKIESFITPFIEKGYCINFLRTDVPGVSNARNIGLDNARGEYICFIDDDDIVSKTYLEELYNVSSRDIVGLSNIFSFEKIPEERGHDFFVTDYISKKKYIENSNICGFRHYICFPVAKLFHRDIIGERRFDRRFTNGEDGLFSRLISDRYVGLRCTSENAIYYVRMRKGSASRKKLPISKIVKDTLLLWRTYIGYYFSNPRGYSLKLYLISLLGVLRNDWVLLKNRI